MNSNKFLVPVLLVIALVATGSIAFVVSQNSKGDDDSDFKIAASIFPVYDITKNIAGEDSEVVQVLPKGASPHTYEPSPQDQLKLEGVDVLFVIGHELDNWAIEMARAANPGVKVVTVDKNIGLKEGLHTHEDEYSDEEEHSDEEEGQEYEENEEDHEEEGYDPHYWLSITNGIKMAETISEELSELNPNNKETYEENTRNYTQELIKLRGESISKLANISSKELITFHDAFGYFAEEFDLEVVATIEEFPGKEPTPAYINEVIQTVNEHDIRVLFKEPGLSDSVVNALSSDYGIEVKTLDPEGSLEDNDSYIKLIKYNVETIAEALK